MKQEMTPTHLAIAGALQGHSMGGSLRTGNPGISMTRKLEPWEDPFRGKSFKGKTINNFGIIEVVDFTYEDQGKQYVTFKSGISMPSEHLSASFEMMEFGVGPVNPNLAAGLEDADAPRSVRSQNNNSKNQRQETYIQREVQRPIKKSRVDNSFDPVFEILKKMKVNPTTCNLAIDLNIPKIELFETLNQSFENFEEKLVDFIFQEENLKQFKISLRQSLRTYYGLDPLDESQLQKITEKEEEFITEDVEEDNIQTPLIVDESKYEIDENDFLALQEQDAKKQSLPPVPVL